MSYPTTVQEAVANGAQMLDEKAPGWHRLINLKRLDIGSCERCVCGQLAYELGWDHLPGLMRGYPEEFGFDSSYPNWGYVELDDEWKLAIKARLELDKRPKQEEEVTTCDRTSSSAPTTAATASTR